MENPKPDTAAKLDDPGDGFGPYPDPDTTRPYVQPELAEDELEMSEGELQAWYEEELDRHEVPDH